MNINVQLKQMLLYLTNMTELQMAATSSENNNQPGILGNYSVLKILLNRDYLAKDKFGQKYLLCHSTKKYQHQAFELGQSHIIKSIQSIKDDNSHYLVFPMQKKLVWAGDTGLLKNKSQINSIALLYSAIRHIIKPILALPLALNLLKFICVDNMWYKGTSLFLFLCNRHNDNNNVRNEKNTNRKLIANVISDNPLRQKVQISVIARVGEIFWSVFFTQQEGTQNNTKKTFKQIVKLMAKGQIKLAQLQNIMEDRVAKKRFVLSLNSRKSTIDPRSGSQLTIESPNQTISQQSVFNKIQNIQIRSGKPYNGMLFQKRSPHIFTPSYKRKKNVEIILDQDYDNYPPSFSKTKRHKRLSLFSGTRYRYQQPFKDSQNNAMTLNSLNSEDPVRHSLDIGNLNNKYINAKIGNKFKAHDKVRRQLRKFFDENIKSLNPTRKSSRIQTLEEHSREKALASFKKSIDFDKSDEDRSIDDSQFIITMKVKRQQFKNNFHHSLIKAHHYFNNLESKNLNFQDPSQRYQNLNINQQQYTNRHQKRIHALESNQSQKQIIESKQKNINKSNKNIQQSKIHNQAAISGQQKNVAHKLDEGLYIQFDKNLRDPINRHEQQKKIIKQYNYPDNISNPKKQNTQKNYCIQKPNKEIFSRNIKQQQQPKLIQKPNLQISRNQVKTDGKLYDQTKKNPNIFNRQDSKVQLLPIITQKKEPQNINLIPKQQIKQPNQIINNKQLTKEQKGNDKIKLPQMQSKSQVKLNMSQVYQNKLDQIKQINLFDNKQRKNQQKVVPPLQKPQKQVKIPKITKKQKIINNKLRQQLNDQIEQINLTSTKNIPQNALNYKPALSKDALPSTNIGKNQLQKNQPQQLPKPASPLIQPSTLIKKQPIQNPTKVGQDNNKQPAQQKKQEKKQRLKTGQSNASSNGNKPVKKQIDQYIYMINKMGEAVAKTSKLSKKLQKVQWFVGLYFLYKRFFYERKKIQKYLLQQIPKLTRYEPFSSQQWKQWLKKGEKDALLAKCQEDNSNIQKSIKKMSKKIEAMQLPASILLNINLNKSIHQSTKIAVQHVVDEYDQLVQQNLIKDGQIYTHMCQMINALYVVAEIDGKIKQKKSVLDYGNVKRSREELNKLVQNIFDLYQEH